MYGGSSKLGRGGGRGGGAGGPTRGRSSFPPPSHRIPSAVGRMSVGGVGSSAPRQRSTTGATGAAKADAPRAVEETFSLVPSKSPPAFAMIIRLAPDLVEEIRRVESQCGTAKIKFDAFSNNTSGNIIDVGGKEFKFTWSQELGDLCDIYEEQRSGGDVNGVLIESGCAWRKLNVQRTLDESTTNHVKMRSVEAEQRTNSRKAIVLDPGNPSLTKQLALAEANPWKMLNKHKKEPPLKRRKVDPPPVPIGGPKLASKPGPSTAARKGRPSASPGPSPPNRSNASPSLHGIGNFARSDTVTDDITKVQTKGKENIAVSKRDPSTRAANALRGASGNKASNVNKPIDLQTFLINLLKDAPMSFKALERAVGAKLSSATKDIEPILKKIANFQAPGRYYLKPGKLESYKKVSPESRSSLEDQQLQPITEGSHDRLLVPGVENVVNFSVCEPSGQCQQDGMHTHLNGQSSSPENVDIERLSPGVLGEGKAYENREGQVGSSSDSGSDSKSDSGSDSRSSSDNEASSNSKEGSDEDVDIMSDDDREPRHTIELKLGLLASTLPSQTDGCGIDYKESAGKQEGDGFNTVDFEGHDSEAVDIEGHDSVAVDIEGHDSGCIGIDRHGYDAVDFEDQSCDEGHASDGVRNFYPENNWNIEATADLSPPANEDGRNLGQEPCSSHHDKLGDRHNFIGRLFDNTENIVKDSLNKEKSDSSERLAKGKSKRDPVEHFIPKSERAKRLKAESRKQISNLGKDSQPSENMYNSTPNKYDDELAKASGSQTIVRVDWETDGNCDSHRQPSNTFIENSNSERSNKHIDASGIARKSAEDPHETLSIRTGNASRDNVRDGYHPKEMFPRNKKDGELASKHELHCDALRKHSKLDGNDKDAENASGLNLGSSPLDNQRTSLSNFPVKGNGSMLQKVVSDLELGELRESLGEDTAAKQHERKSSFRQLYNEPSTSENWKVESDKRKPSKKSIFDSKKNPAPSHAGSGMTAMPEQGVEDSARSHKWALHSHPLHHLGEDNYEIGSQRGKLKETNNRSRQNNDGARPGLNVEAYGEIYRKESTVAPQQHGPEQGLVSHSSREIKRHACGATENLVNGQKDTGLIPSDGVDGSQRETSFEEEDSIYLKYEKAAPELKGPICDYSQYKAYVQEYQDKYGSYSSLNKILDNYRNEFQKMGEDLEFAKYRDLERYSNILQQLKESYLKYGERHKRLKKIFVVLHEELKHLKQRMKEYASSRGKD